MLPEVALQEETSATSWNGLVTTIEPFVRDDSRESQRSRRIGTGNQRSKNKLEEKSGESQRSHWKLGTRRQRKATVPNQGVRWLNDDGLVLEELSDWGGVIRNPVLRPMRSKV
ncbi:hypothetical protein U1Q18_032191 [Sarracenia purpurea var. burkii]